MIFNFGVVKEIRLRDSIKRADLADLLDVTDNYLYRLEKGLKQPSLNLIRRVSEIIGVPVEDLFHEHSPPEATDGEVIYEGARTFVEIVNKLNRERQNRFQIEKRNLELERMVEHLLVVIHLYMRFGDILSEESLSRSEKMKKMEKLAITTASEGEINFNEILAVLKIKRSTLRNWLRSEKIAYPCLFAEGGEIMASTPGEAALKLGCFDCEGRESGECKGHGNEKGPENLIVLITRLEANGVINRTEQSRVLEESYGVSISAHEISEIVYRDKHDIRMPEGVFNMEANKTRR